TPVLQVFHERRPGRIHRPAQGAHLGSVVRMRVPAVECHLDEGYLSLDQSTGQQTALAEQISAIGVPHSRFLLAQIKRTRRCRPHEAHRPFVGALVTYGRGVRVSGEEVVLDLLEELDPSVSLAPAYLAGRHQVLDAKCPVRAVWTRLDGDAAFA